MVAPIEHLPLAPSDVSDQLSVSFTSPAPITIAAARFLAGLVDVTLVNPNLYADDAIGRKSLGETIVDIRSQCMQGELPVQVPLRARDLSTVKSAAAANLNPLRSESKRSINRPAHGPAESHTLD